MNKKRIFSSDGVLRMVSRIKMEIYDSTTITWRFMGKAFFVYYKSDGFMWFRLFERGLVFKNTKKTPLTFSERNGVVKCLRIGKWAISYLPK